MNSKSLPISTRDRKVISDTNAAPLVQILAWLLLSFSILFVGAQFGTKRALSRRFEMADLALLVALTFAVGQTSTLLSPAGQVIGNATSTLSEKEIHQALKALYSGEILSIFTLVVTKGSMLIALHAITPYVAHRMVIYGVTIVTVAWGVSAIFAVAFQCSSPRRWDIEDHKCINIQAARIYISTMNILTDIALIIIPSMIIVPVQMSWGRRLTVLGGFWFRIMVIAASIVQIIYIRRLVFDKDFLNNVWRTVVCTEIVQATSITTACIPFLKPFLMSLESGFLRADDEHRRATAGMYGSGDRSSSGWASKYINIRNQRSRDSSIKLQESIRRTTDE
ncbi:hypothetical protein K505DRAFT_303805 [Melanomma pulvis-pyrius CBS 109.77]|uniref:Rhodopsin domain-containing protein n=1 Tax=Melanomma pulvis-pyrius CBS 109.77 TaxID=1314802 RepID=A0A6A6XD95_9PLEO|nr:hypothetical protein K505DRAFT_303805 [Melanomma pulvis-pyrius CBS 109.77]